MRFMLNMLPWLSAAACERLACQHVLTARTCAPGPVGEFLQVCIGEQHKKAEATRMLLGNACKDVVPDSLACLQCGDIQDTDKGRQRGEEHTGDNVSCNHT